MNPKAKATKQDSLPKWLIRVQQQSWEPEILISGIVLLALFQLPSKIDDLYLFINKYSYSLFYRSTADETLTNVMRIAIYWLIAGFSAHLFFRSIWVAYVGLSYVYPKGIKKEGIRYSKRYRERIGLGVDTLKRIKKLERLCSSMFALGFLFFMIVFGFFFAFLIISVLLISMIYSFPSFGYYHYFEWLFLGLFFIYLVDFVSLGWFKRIPYISTIYYPLYRLQSYLTLSFLYRDVLYYFISNHKKWKVFLFVFLFTTISVFADVAFRNDFNLLNDIELAKIENDSKVIFNEHYENLANRKIIYTIRVESDVISGDYLRAFIAHTAFNESKLKNQCFLKDSVYSVSNKLSDSVKIACLNQLYSIQINDSIFESDYLFTNHPETDQPGLMAYLDVSYLNNGMHSLILFNNIYHKSSDSVSREKRAIVEFIKQ